MAKFRIKYSDGFQQLEAIVTAPSTADARQQFLDTTGAAIEDLEIIDVKKVAAIASSNPDLSEPKGRTKVEGVVKGASERLRIATRSGKIVWPIKGGMHEGLEPGAWRVNGTKDSTGCLPHDCPVKPLGYEGENFYLIDTLGQVFNTGAGAWGVERMQKLFAGQEEFLCWAYPSWSKGSPANPAQVVGFKAEEVRKDLFAACARRGPWSMTDMVRGRGAWLDDRERLVLHCGEQLVVDGEAREAGEHGEHFYPRRPAIATPWAAAVERPEDNPAVSLFQALRTWNFVRGDIDVMLFMGWIGVALMGGALEWRPSAFIIGDAGTGKSQLQKLLKMILGRALLSTTNATEAGLYQLVGHDSLPIAIDELEGEDGQQQAAKIIKMARDAASGSIRVRGGQDHKGVEFTARSAFLFSAINPPPLPPATLTRLAVLQLRPLVDTGKAVPHIAAPETIVPMLLRRIVDHWDDFGGKLELYRKVLREVGKHDSRGQDTFGTFLAAAHLLLGDEGMEACLLPWETEEKLGHYGIMLRADVAPELEGRQPNWLRCIEAIFTAQPDVWRSGERKTIAQVVEDALDGDLFNGSAGQLAAADLGLVKANGQQGMMLAIPNTSKTLGKLLTDTSYGSANGAGNWTFALKQAPDEIVVPKVVLKPGGKPDNRLSIAGFQRRCTFIDVRELKTWQENQG